MAALLTKAVIQWSIWISISMHAWLIFAQTLPLLFAFDVFRVGWRQSYQQHTHKDVLPPPSICRYNTNKYLHNLSTAAVGPRCLLFPNGDLERMFFDDCSDVATPEFNEWERFYRNYAQGKKAINFLMDSMFYSWHLFGLGHGKAHTELVPRCHHMGKMAISFFIHVTNDSQSLCTHIEFMNDLANGGKGNFVSVCVADRGREQSRRGCWPVEPVPQSHKST